MAESVVEFSAVINAKGEIVAHGFWEIAAFTGIIFGGEAALKIGSELNVHMAGHNVARDMDLLLTERSVKAYGGLYGSDNKFKRGAINAINNLGCNNIIVAPDQQAIFEVAMNITYEMVKDANVMLISAAEIFRSLLLL